jgi:hypothetical protein
MSAKYPRTPHLPFSPGGTKDDRRLADVSELLGRDLILTEKMDGSNLCLTRGNVFARSHAGPPVHASFDMAKSLHAQVRAAMAPGLSYFGEWCFAVHSIEYEVLPSYFLLFGIRDDEKKTWLGWDDILLFADDLGLGTVPVLAEINVNDARELEKIVTTEAVKPSLFGPRREGAVVRWRMGYAESEFERAIAKWVRANHVETDEHWKHGPIRKQGLVQPE